MPKRDIDREIYEYSEVEGEAERMMQFVPECGLMHRILAWCARQCAEARADLREWRDGGP